MKNEYYSIAINDLLYTQGGLNRGNYNPLVVEIQQIAEKALKSVLELIDVNIIELLHSHNLRQIYTRIHSVEPKFILNEKDLGYLKDFYFEAKYPGENFIIVSREQCIECLHIMYTVLKEVNKFRKENSLKIFEFDEKELEEPLNKQMHFFD